MVVMEEVRLRPNIWLLTGIAGTVQGGSEGSLAKQGFRSCCCVHHPFGQWRSSGLREEL